MSRVQRRFSAHDSVQSQGDIKSPFLFASRQNHLPRNTFDLSRHSLFSTPPGLMLPTFCQDVMPGDHLSLNVQNFTRTEPMNTAAFSRVREVTDFFFVPYQLLWSGFESFMSNVRDFNSSLLDPNTFSEVPSLTMGCFFRDSSNYSLSQVDDFNIPRVHTLNRLWSLLGYPHTDVKGNAPFNDALVSRKVNPFRLLAWNKIWSDFYRLSDFEPLNVNIFNCDKGFSITHVNSTSGKYYDLCSIANHYLDFDCIHYVPWAKDRFTSLKPSRLVQSDDLMIPIDFDESGNFWSQVVHSSKGCSQISDPAGLKSVSTDDLRNLLSLDKLARVSMLAPKYFKSQIEAHYGVNVSSCQQCSSSYLGSFDSQLQIGEVLGTAAGQTSAGSSSVLGQIAGRGVSSSNGNKPISFDANQFGIVMGVHYLLPLSDYDNDVVDDFNLKINRYDYFQPEFDNLGLQPLSMHSVASPSMLANHYDDTLGWQSRYMEYKSSFDLVHGQFRSGGTLTDWNSPRPFPNAVTPNDNFGVGLRVSPKVLDPIFALAFNGSDVTDPFLCHYSFDVKMSRNMSVNGLPII